MPGGETKGSGAYAIQMSAAVQCGPSHMFDMSGDLPLLSDASTWYSASKDSSQGY